MIDLLERVRDEAFKRPRLLVPLLGGAFLLGVLDPVSAVLLKVLLGAAVTVAVTAAFAEMWIRENEGLDAGRLLETGVLFLLPYPLLMLFAALSTGFVYFLLHGPGGRLAVAAVYGVVILGKLVAFGGGVVSALAAARRREAGGALEALGLGFKTAGANARLLAALIVSTYLFQEACVYLTARLYPVPFLAKLFTTGIPLFGCVAAPIQAWRSGRLTKA